jgi:hypothetical protein
MNAIPTHYNGINFRSRLEAKWARFFDLLGWPYEYEPIDLNGYIPDFVLKFDTPIAVEIKPDFTRIKLTESAGKALIACNRAGIPLLCLGATLIEEITYSTVGLGLIDVEASGYLEPAEFSWCSHHKGYAFYPPEGLWMCMRCGGKCQEVYNKPYWFWNRKKEHAADLDKIPGETPLQAEIRLNSRFRDTDAIQQFWSEATNLTQYKRIFLAE